MAEETSQAKAKCLNCQTVVEANPRQITGCNCDPDAPTWVYIQDNRVRGFSQARWDVV